MRKIVWQISVSLDGFYEGLNGEIDWHAVDGEYNEYAAGMLDASDTLLLGRVTGQLMAGYWTQPGVIASDPVIADRMNRLRKVVVSATLDKLEWQNTLLIREDAMKGIAAMKREPGSNLSILGSPRLAAGLARENLIDEYQFIVCPVLLGEGKPLFRDFGGLRRLALLQAKPFRSGAVLMIYKPEQAD